MEKVIEIKEIKEQDKTLGPYTRRRCLVKTLENKEEKSEIYFLDEEAILEKIYAYINYLNSMKDNGIKQKRSLTTEERRNRNMKASMVYSLGVVLILLSLLTSEVLGIPLLIGGVVVILGTAVVANDLLFYHRIENSPLVLDIEDKINEAKELEKEVEYEMSRKESMDFARYKFEKIARQRKQVIIDKISLRNAIEDLRYRAVREAWAKYSNLKPSRVDDNIKNDGYHELPDVIVARR